MELKQGLIFDFNGTLVDDGHLHEAAWVAIAAQRFPGRFSTEEISRLIRGRSNKDIVSSLLGSSVSDPQIRELAGAKEALYRESCLDHPDFHLTPSVAACLDRLLSQGRQLALATAAPHANIEFFIQQLGIDRWFAKNLIFYDNGSFPGKPAPDIFIKAAAAFGLSPAECTVFDDSPAGMTAAKLAGIGQIVHVDLTGRIPILPGAHERIQDFGGIP
ncbi:MAG TPA: HAD family phosphatase [Candidatus Obscuribacterales bacterium]